MPNEKQKFSQRLHEALDDMNYPRMGHGRQSALTKELKLSSSVVGDWLKGEGFPKTSQLVKVSDFLNVRSNWLLSGVGSKYKKKNKPDFVLKKKKSEVKTDEDAKENENETSQANLQSNNLFAVNVQQSPRLDKDAFEMALAWTKLPEQQRIALRKVILELVDTAGDED